MIQTLDVTETIDIPILGNIRHGKFLALIDKNGTGLEGKEGSQHFTGEDAVLGGGGGEARDRAALIVVFEVESVPAVVVDHEALPFEDKGTELGEGPGSTGEFVVCSAVHVNAGDLLVVGKYRRPLEEVHTFRSGRSCSTLLCRSPPPSTPHSNHSQPASLPH